jgi:DNA-binding NarL/FixJ family response regulator
MTEDAKLLRFYIDLTSRERDVLQLVTKGLTNREVADQLSIAASSVAEHLTNIYEKLSQTEGLGASSAPKRYAVISLFAGFFERHPELHR